MTATQLDQDTFSRANTTASTNIATGWGTASGGSTWSVQTGGATFSIVSNEGHATACTSLTFVELGSSTSKNAEAVVRLRVSDTNVTAAGIMLRQTGSTTTYRCRINSNASSQGFGIVKTISGTTTNLFVTSFTPTLNSYYWIRFRVVNSTLYGRVWADGSSEPTTWNVSGTDTSITAAGGFGLVMNSSSSSTTFDFDNLTVYNATTTITAPVRVRLAAQVTKTTQVRTLLRALNTRTAQARLRLTTGGGTTSKNAQVRTLLRAMRTRTAQIRAIIGLPTTTRTALARIRLSASDTDTAPVRLLLRTTNTQVFQVRLVLSPARTLTAQIRFVLAAPSVPSGGFALFANGSGTVSYDSFRVTEYPDPALVLGPVVPRVGATSILWNATVPTNTTLGMDISYDGVNWTDVSSNNGGSLPSIYSQPMPTIDGFGTNTSVNYTSTFRTGGAAGTWTYDTANSRLVATSGTNAIYVYSSISRADVDFFTDLDRSDAGGLVWRYIDANNFYYLLIGDSLASSGTPNTVTLYKVATNTQTQLATAAISYTVGTSTSAYTVTFVRGTYRRFRVTMLSGVITVYCDGVQLLTYTDGSPLAAGLMGIYNNGGVTGSRYYQLWLQPLGDSVTGTPSGDTVTGKFVYTRQRLATTDPTATPQVLDLTTTAFSPNIQAGTTIPSIAYNATFVSKNYDDLAKQSNYSWYIDQSKTLFFRATATVAAPWILQSSPTGLVQNVDLEVSSNLELDVQNDLYRNRQTVIGAIATLTASATFIGDGSTRQFTLGYPLNSAPTIILNNIVQTVGLKGTSGYQWYYAVGDAVLEQDASGAILSDTDQLSVPSYVGQYVTNVTVDNAAAQSAQAAIEGGTGIVEAVEDHTSEKLSVAAATTLAQQLLTRYSTLGRTLIFDTTRNGLAVGQTLSIFFPEQGINDGQFYVNQVEVTLQKNVSDAQIWWYKVTCSELPRQASWAKLIASGLSLQ